MPGRAQLLPLAEAEASAGLPGGRGGLRRADGWRLGCSRLGRSSRFRRRRLPLTGKGLLCQSLRGTRRRRAGLPASKAGRWVEGLVGSFGRGAGGRGKPGTAERERRRQRQPYLCAVPGLLSKEEKALALLPLPLAGPQDWSVKERAAGR